MGYYDEGYTRPKKQKSGRRTLFTALTSSVIGGVISLSLLPALSNLGVLPYEVVMKNEEAVAQPTVAAGSKTTPTQQNVTVNVSSDVIDAVEKVSDAIVGVVNIQEVTDFFSQGQQIERGTGSGVVYEIDKISGKARIVTNYHVIENAKQVEISLANGERVKASLKGADPLTDLAVLEIDAKHVETVAKFGDSDAVRTGEPAIAIGNPLGLEFSRTVTQGIISAKDRSVPVSSSWELNVLQTDAAINPGNSGGALINIKGQVIGINSLKIAQQGIEGLGFAIPINDVIPIINDLVQYGEVQRPYMGISPYDLAEVSSEQRKRILKLPNDVNTGVVILGVEALSASDQGGLQKHDVIVKLDGEEIKNSLELRKYIFNKKKIGDKLEVSFYREGLLQTTTITLDKVLKAEQ